MFTGLIERTGCLAECVVDDRGGHLCITCESAWNPPLQVGESVATQGVCLTVKACTGTEFKADLLQETLRCTSFTGMKARSRVNLERALRAGDRLGGHFVTGHVDATGILRSVERDGSDWVLDIQVPKDLGVYLAVKGSVACDGVSLTIAHARHNGIQVHLIPHTWAMTTLKDRVIGDAINLECDPIARHAVHAMRYASSRVDVLTPERLRAAGYE